MRLIPSVAQAYLAEVKIESEAQVVVGWEYCRGDEGEVGEEPKAHLCKPGVMAVWAGSVGLLPKTWAVAWMGEIVAGANAGEEKEKSLIWKRTEAAIPIQGERSAKWWDR